MSENWTTFQVAPERDQNGLREVSKVVLSISPD